LRFRLLSLKAATNIVRREPWTVARGEGARHFSRYSCTPSADRGTKVKHRWQKNEPGGLIMESDISSASDDNFSFL